MRRSFGAGLIGAFILAATAALDAVPGAWAAGGDEARSVERGRYLVTIGGCNDCHTPGYPEAAGQVPERDWLVGDRLGWRGPWGTTYPTNLRLLLNSMDAGQWVEFARNMQPRPPMPWFNMRAMSDDDLVAIHRFVAALGPAGEPAPPPLPPGEKPSGPHVQFPSP